MKKSYLPLLLLIFLTIGCSYSSHFVQDGAQTFTPTNPDEIEIFSADIEQDYIVIGPIASDVAGNGDKAAAKIKAEAATIGADAIIFVKLTKMQSSVQRTGISGVAVKYQD